MNRSECVREATLLEEIGALRDYNVPDNVIERMISKLTEYDERQKRGLENRDYVIQDLQDSNRNHKAVINALGAYLVLQEAIVREV